MRVKGILGRFWRPLFRKCSLLTAKFLQVQVTYCVPNARLTFPRALFHVTLIRTLSARPLQQVLSDFQQIKKLGFRVLN